MIAAEELLQQTIRTLGLKEEAEVLFNHWPNLRDAVLRLADYMGDIVLEGHDRPLYTICVQDGFNALKESSADQDDSRQMTAFLRGLLDQAAEIINYQVFVMNGRKRIVWEPFAQSLRDWVQENAARLPYTVKKARYCDITPNSVQIMLASRIMTVCDISAIGGRIERFLQV